MKSIFFYGLFMDRELLVEKGFNPSEPILAHVKGFGLRIGERASLVESKDEISYGVIMSLREFEVNQLYSEESVKEYLPVELVAFISNTEKINVVAYNLPKAILKGKNKSYAESLAKVANKVGLPLGYINEIKRWAT